MYDDYVDNTHLASRHTPRLNAFLDTLREASDRTGGTMRLDPDTDHNLLSMLDDSGVLLDAPRPLEQPSLQWPEGIRADGLLTSIRYGVDYFRRVPVPPPYRPVVRLIIEHPGHELFRAGADEIRRALREPGDPALRLAAVELDGVAAVEVDNWRGRFSFTPGELASRAN
jgi:hypothetical protein